MVGQDPTRIFISQLKLKRMLTKQLREMERQAQVIEQHQNLLKLDDLMCHDDLLTCSNKFNRQTKLLFNRKTNPTLCRTI